MAVREAIGGENTQLAAMTSAEALVPALLAGEKRESQVLLPADPLEAATQIIDLAESRGVRLRLLGGLAFKQTCPSAREPVFFRKNKDIDLIGRHEGRGEVMKILETLGYKPRTMFNAYSMGKRLIYYDRINRRRIDIFFDEFKMCHRFNFRNKLLPGGYTLPLTQLIITKLQVVEKTEREYLDLLAAFHDFDVNDGKDSIHGYEIAELCAKDWGVCTTFRKSLDSLKQTAEMLEEGKREIIIPRIQKLVSAIDSKPKGVAWRLREVIGEKARWYKIPEPDSDAIFN